MAFIPQRNYTQAHLDQVCCMTGIQDWFTFLDRPDRLVYLMEISWPHHVSLRSSCKERPEAIVWSDLVRIISKTNFYGLWANRTGQEYWVAEIIKKMVLEWHHVAGYFYPQRRAMADPDGIKADRIWERYLQLTEWVKDSRS